MPRMDGLELVRILKGHDQLKKIPVLMVTSHSEQNKMREALSAGVDGYLMKPFTEAMLRRSLQTLTPGASELDYSSEERLPETSNLLRQLLEVSNDELLSGAHIQEYKRGATILRAGDAVDALYLILEGRVRAEGVHSSESYQQGDGLALMELISHDELQQDYVAWQPSRIARVDGGYFEQLLHNSAELSMRITRYVAQRASLHSDSGGNDKGLKGSFDVLELPDLLQALNLRQSSGTLELIDVDASIHIVLGEVVAVRCGNDVGVPAFRKLIEQHPSGFKFFPGMRRVERNVEMSTTRLLMDTMRDLDEATAV
jgi:CheY-like chemotaxis protein